MQPQGNTLSEIRETIDHIDQEMLILLNQRANAVKQVKKIKMAESESPEYYRPEREAMQLRQKMAQYQGDLDPKGVASIFRAIMSSCLALQEEQRIAFLGPEGTFSHEAAIKHFGDMLLPVSGKNLTDVFNLVTQHQVHFCVVPICNSTEGFVNQTLDLLLSHDLKICGEVKLRIHQHLLRGKSDLLQIKRVYSHAQSLAQCNQWLMNNLPNVELCAVQSNAKAAELASTETGVATIAGEIARQHYDLVCVQPYIEDNHDNTTRFLILGQRAVKRSGDDMTSLIIVTPHTAAQLPKLLTYFIEQNISGLAARPCQHYQGAHYYTIDIKGHIEDNDVQEMLARLEDAKILYKLLGSYPCAIGG